MKNLNSYRGTICVFLLMKSFIFVDKVNFQALLMKQHLYIYN